MHRRAAGHESHLIHGHGVHRVTWDVICLGRPFIQASSRCIQLKQPNGAGADHSLVPASYTVHGIRRSPCLAQGGTCQGKLHRLMGQLLENLNGIPHRIDMGITGAVIRRYHDPAGFTDLKACLLCQFCLRQHADGKHHRFAGQLPS